jgi:hypothetical protein
LSEGCRRNLASAGALGRRTQTTAADVFLSDCFRWCERFRIPAQTPSKRSPALSTERGVRTARGTRLCVCVVGRKPALACAKLRHGSLRLTCFIGGNFRRAGADSVHAPRPSISQHYSRNVGSARDSTYTWYYQHTELGYANEDRRSPTAISIFDKYAKLRELYPTI